MDSAYGIARLLVSASTRRSSGSERERFKFIKAKPPHVFSHQEALYTQACGLSATSLWQELFQGTLAIRSYHEWQL